MIMARDLDFDAAILDLNLRSQQSDPVADIFLSRNIPFVISSGSPGDALVPCVMDNAGRA